jgi:D-alanine-D-alanine ligase
MTAIAPRKVTRATDFGRVGLLIGGDSAEREVSLSGGKDIARAFRRLKIRHEVYDGAPSLLEAILARQVDRVFNLMHGPGGEDGAIQGALQLLRVPVTGSGVLGSALTMDKARSKWLLQRLGLPTAPFALLGRGADPKPALEEFGLPVFVKPNCLGSSIGISKVERPSDLAAALELAFGYGSEVIIEKAIVGREYFTGILGSVALPLIGIETPRPFYDYEAKYRSDETRYHCPCGLDLELERSLQAQSMAVFDGLGATGWGRVDFILDGAGKPWFLEVNTAPGMTDHSLMPQAAAQMGVDFDELVWRVLETSL